MPYLLSSDYGTREYENRTERTYDALCFFLLPEFPPKKPLSKMKEDGHKNQEQRREERKEENILEASMSAAQAQVTCVVSVSVCQWGSHQTPLSEN
jgi:hypothetical protein